MSEFMRIELQDMQLEKGLLYLRARRHKLARYVPLNAGQVLSLDRYVREVRPSLLQDRSDKFFVPQADNYELLHYQFRLLSIKVKAHAKEHLDIAIHKLGQLRQSRVAIWFNEEGLRKAQYLAGMWPVRKGTRKPI